MQVLFQESTIFMGTFYVAGRKYNLPAPAVSALGDSVKVLNKKDEPEVEEVDAAEVEEKEISAPPVDKMVRSANVTKK